MIEGSSSGSGSRAGSGSVPRDRIPEAQKHTDPTNLDQNTAQKRTSSISKQEISHFFTYFVGHFALLDLDPDQDKHSQCGSRCGSTALVQRGRTVTTSASCPQQREAGVCGDDPDMMIIDQLRKPTATDSVRWPNHIPPTLIKKSKKI
jgi:hypothetical protein